ncbi:MULTISPECIES: YhjD/YihY/BrkB family envelope integrity protein [unclassified Streptomyces]|uniref:YhjD/YihY/BrkB family envelope integrity protein n=1 Tax=unclassified Streptomyces TaxID=2593676 RepID=UPI00386AFE0D
MRTRSKTIAAPTWPREAHGGHIAPARDGAGFAHDPHRHRPRPRPQISGSVRNATGGLSPVRRNGARAADPAGAPGGTLVARSRLAGVEPRPDPGSRMRAGRGSGSPTGGAASRLRGRAAHLRARLLRLRHTAEGRFPVITHLTSHLIAVNLLDSATRLAAQVFLTAVPLLFVFASFAPQVVRNEIVSSLHDVFGINGSAEQELKKVFQADSESLRQSTGAVSGLMVLLSATACSRAMQRLCQRAWRLPSASARIAAWRWLVWIAAWLVVLALQGPLRSGFGAGPWLGLPLLLVTQVGVWWWTQHLLLAARIPWLPLLPGALLTGVAMTALTVVSKLYVPTALNRSLDRYGSLGAVFTVLSWLIGLCVVIAACITAGAVIAREPAVSRRLDPPE